MKTKILCLFLLLTTPFVIAQKKQPPVESKNSEDITKGIQCHNLPWDVQASFEFVDDRPSWTLQGPDSILQLFNVKKGTGYLGYLQSKLKEWTPKDTKLEPIFFTVDLGESLPDLEKKICYEFKHAFAHEVVTLVQSQVKGFCHNPENFWSKFDGTAVLEAKRDAGVQGAQAELDGWIALRKSITLNCAKFEDFQRDGLTSQETTQILELMEEFQRPRQQHQQYNKLEGKSSGQ